MRPRFLAALQQAGLPAALIKPRAARQLAAASGKLAKTDKIDAQVLAHFAETMKPEPQPLPDPALAELKATLQRRAQVVKMIGQEEHRLEKATTPSARRHIEAHLDWLQRSLANLDRELKDLILQSPAWQEQDRLLQSVPGIGPTISRALIARLPELGTLSGNKLAALVGGPRSTGTAAALGANA